MAKLKCGAKNTHPSHLMVWCTAKSNGSSCEKNEKNKSRLTNSGFLKVNTITAVQSGEARE